MGGNLANYMGNTSINHSFEYFLNNWGVGAGHMEAGINFLVAIFGADGGNNAGVYAWFFENFIQQDWSGGFAVSASDTNENQFFGRLMVVVTVENTFGEMKEAVFDFLPHFEWFNYNKPLIFEAILNQIGAAVFDPQDDDLGLLMVTIMVNFGW